MPLIDLTLRIEAPRPLVFDLARSIDLHERSTAQTHERAVAGRTSGLIEQGETVTWHAKHLGVYQTLTACITELMFPEYFVDEMVSGAFAAFRHTHRFEAVGSATLMHDRFDYRSPFGAVGRLADWLFLERYMHRLLRHRNEVIRWYAESGRWK